MASRGVAVFGVEIRQVVLEEHDVTAADFPDDRIHVVANSSEAGALLAKTTRRGDVVLFENDLPDLYAEDGNSAARH